jgi:hypothetical protein
MSTRNLKIIIFLESQRGRCVGLTTLPPSVSRLSRQCGILNISQPCRPSRPVTGISFIWIKRNIGLTCTVCPKSRGGVLILHDIRTTVSYFSVYVKHTKYCTIIIFTTFNNWKHTKYCTIIIFTTFNNWNSESRKLFAKPPVQPSQNFTDTWKRNLFKLFFNLIHVWYLYLITFNTYNILEPHHAWDTLFVPCHQSCYIFVS